MRERVLSFIRNRKGNVSIRHIGIMTLATFGSLFAGIKTGNPKQISGLYFISKYADILLIKIITAQIVMEKVMQDFFKQHIL